MREVYENLYRVYMMFYKGHFLDEYRGQNKLSRMATIYAVTNTKIVWAEEASND